MTVGASAVRFKGVPAGERFPRGNPVIRPKQPSMAAPGTRALDGRTLSSVSDSLKAKPLIRPSAPTPPPGPTTPARGVRAPATDNSVYTKGCPAQRALEVIASKWAILVLHSLRNGPVRFNALQRELHGVSQKVLSQQLRRLESYGLVTRTAHPTVPPSVEYALTPAAVELKEALNALCAWADRHLPERGPERKPDAPAENGDRPPQGRAGGAS